MSRLHRYEIPMVATIRPCETIAPEAFAGGSVFATLGDRYAPLMTELPLAGGPAMRPTAGGGMLIIEQLRASAPWLGPAILKIERQLRIQDWAGRPWLGWRPLLLVGAPGTGKSHLARLIARLSGAGTGVLDVGGATDSRTLEGTARGWTSAQPSWPAVMMSQTRCANPVLVVEEVDKARSSPQGGSTHDVLLTMIEAETSATYWDKCLLSNIDLSHICWILTANDPRLLPPTLLSRLDVVQVSGPSIGDFDLLMLSITSDLARLWDVPVGSMPALPSSVLGGLETTFQGTRSARRLRRAVEAAYGAVVVGMRRQSH